LAVLQFNSKLGLQNQTSWHSDAERNIGEWCLIARQPFLTGYVYRGEPLAAENGTKDFVRQRRQSAG